MALTKSSSHICGRKLIDVRAAIRMDEMKDESGCSVCVNTDSDGEQLREHLRGEQERNEPLSFI